MVQRRAAKLIFPNSGVDTNSLLKNLNLVLLTRREAHTAILTKKWLENRVPPYLKGYFNLNSK